ncbi:MAG: HAD family hydrolase [Evtepia sp.]
MLVKGSNYLETLSQTDYVVFDKTGTLTQGVFEVVGIHHNTIDEAKLIAYAALAESASSHPISKSLQKAYGAELDRGRVHNIQEISGHGVTAEVDGHTVAAGNDKLMAKLGIPSVPLPPGRYHHSCRPGRTVRRSYPHLRCCEAHRQGSHRRPGKRSA